jgi:hypothetical protein
LKIKSVGAVVEAALPALDGLAVRLLAQMAHVTFNRPASPRSRARVLKEDVSEYIDYGVRDITMVVLATHVATLPR